MRLAGARPRRPVPCRCRWISCVMLDTRPSEDPHGDREPGAHITQLRVAVSEHHPPPTPVERLDARKPEVGLGILLLEHVLHGVDTIYQCGHIFADVRALPG